MAYYFGTTGNDFIDPLNSENDYMFGDAGNDTIYGWYGNDTIYGWTGSDTLYGEAGNDTLNPGSGVNDYIDGGTGIDLLVADYSNVSDSYSFSFDNIEKVSFKGSNGADNFTFNNTTDTLYGNGGDDTLNAGAFNDYLNGGSGNDSLNGQQDDDVLYGEDGNDSLYGGAGNDYIDGGIGNDTLDGRRDNDFIYGDSGTDNLSGFDGNDTLFGGGYDFDSFEYDTLTGGIGADRFLFGVSGAYAYGGSGYATITDFKYGEGDKLQLAGTASLYTESDLNFGVGTAALDTGIYKSGDLIAILQDVSGINFVLNLDTIFV